jgi:hypothetical protein
MARESSLGSFRRLRHLEAETGTDCDSLLLRFPQRFDKGAANELADRHARLLGPCFQCLLKGGLHLNNKTIRFHDGHSSIATVIAFQVCTYYLDRSPVIRLRFAIWGSWRMSTYREAL